MTQPPPRPSLALFPLWVGLIGGFTEVVVLYFRRQSQPLMVLSPDFAWMTPIALLTLTLVASQPLMLLGRRIGRARAAAVFLAAAVVAVDLAMLIPRVAHYAAAALGAGAAVQIARWAVADTARARRLIVRSSPWLVTIVLAGGALIWTSSRPAMEARPSAIAPPNAPSVLLITLDTVRAANVSLYGYQRRTTPNIDRFADRGVTFLQAIAAAPWTLPSHASLFTGRWPHELSASYTAPLDRQYPTLADYLRAQGYQTAGFVANLKFCNASTGLSRGFDHYEDYPRSLGEIAISSTLTRNILDNFRLRELIANDQQIDRVSADTLNARALAWLDEHRAAPFLMFLNYFEAHDPYLPPEPFNRQFGPGRRNGQDSPLHHWLWDPRKNHGNMGPAERQEEIDAYDGAVAYLDASVGRLLAEFDRRGALKNTLVVITADHGEEFAEHGFYEHAYSLYRNSVAVPLVIVSPGRAPEGQRVSVPVSLRNLPRTIVQMLGFGAGAPFPGTSLGAAWGDSSSTAGAGSTLADGILSEVGPSPGQPKWFASSKGDMQSVVYRGVRYIRNGDGAEELYDFNRDPLEQRNLAPLAEWQQALRDARAELVRLMGRANDR